MNTPDAGNGNSFFGYDAVQQNTSNTIGSSNTFIGEAAGGNNRTGSNNTVICSKADVGANNLTNATPIGTGAQVTQNNSLVLGSINGTNGAIADTSVGIGTTASKAKLDVTRGNILVGSPG